MDTPPDAIRPEVYPWMRGVLLLAAIYNLAWGIFIYNFSDSFYHWVTQTNDTTPEVIEYQGLGILLFALLYFVSALYPKKFWYFIIIGVLSKIIGPIWFYFDIMDQQVTKRFLFHIIMNDIAWVIPLAVIAYKASQIKMHANQ
ncbi:MAG: hypothetical protein MI921_16015 [Cytophagales bacterium]|nr:hypothetical protein [Cytophagales bacterium]